MKTVDKALTVLDQFSLEHSEMGLSELSRRAGLDKAATRRLLVALAAHGFVEQSAETRRYRLGHGFLRLARLREASVPIARAAQEVADDLMEAVSETVHVSIPGAGSMATIACRQPRRGHVITILPGETLYYHATASGLVFMAFAAPQTRDRLLSLERPRVVPGTMTDRAMLLDRIEEARRGGYAESRNGLETGVAGLAMPFFADGDDPAGTIAIALPDAHLTAARRAALLGPLSRAVADLERALTGLTRGRSTA